MWCIVGAYLLVHYDSIFLFKFVNQKYNPVADKIMETLSHFGEGPLIIIIGLCFFSMNAFRNRYFFFAAIFCTLIPSIVTQIIKHQIAAPRPITVYANQPWVHHLDHWALLHNNSFPSGHTTAAFSFFCMAACVLPQKFRAFGLLFFAFAIFTGYSRIYLAAHFFADVYAGSIIGTLLSFLISLLIYYFKNKKESVIYSDL